MSAVIRPSKPAWLAFDQIDIPKGARPYNATGVAALAQSIKDIGLQTPLAVVERDGRYMLIAGRHRLEALRVLGVEKVPARVVELDDVEARLWTISENLHRTELTAIQRSEQIAEYARLTQERGKPAQVGPVSIQGEDEIAKLAQVGPVSGESGKAAQLAPVPKGGRGIEGGEVSAQVGQKPQGGRPEGGDSYAARKLGISRQEVQRAHAIAALPDDTKETARALGLDRNQSALLAAAKATTPAEQIEALERRSDRHAPPRPAPPLRNLENIAAGELARWIKITTPNDRRHVIRVLQEAAAILHDEMTGAGLSGLEESP